MKAVKIRLSLLLICLSATITNAQFNNPKNVNREVENRIYLSFNPQRYLNKGGVFNDGNYPDVISAKNTAGYVAALEYEHITKKGFIMSVGFLHGRSKHNVDVTYANLNFFDTINQAQLNQTHNSKNYSGAFNYIGLRFMAGYRWFIPASFLKGWSLEGKAGISFRVSTTGVSESILWRLGYYRNDTLYITYFGSDIATFGKKSSLGSYAWSYNGDLYIGLNKPVQWSFIKSLSIGLTATHGIGGKYIGLGDLTSTTYNFAHKIISIDQYRARDFSLGIRMAIGLWK